MKPLVIICCSVLRRELEEFLHRDYPEAEAVFLDSMLHMHPQRLHRAIDAALAARPDHRCILVYGDCHPHIDATGNSPHCTRVEAINCGDLLLGPDLYKIHRANQAFLFLPEWTIRWREVFEQELGFTNRLLAREFMQEYQKKLVYLDTGLLAVPEKLLEEISAYFAMPMEIVTVSLGPLRQAIRAAVQRLEEKSHGL